MNLGRFLITAGVLLVALGGVLLVLGKFNVPVGRLPGDIVWRGKNGTVYFPWVTCLLLSLLGTALLCLLNRRS